MAEKDVKSEGGDTSTGDTTMLGSSMFGAAAGAASGAAATATTAASGAANAIPTNQEDLKSQLEEAKATITRLQAQAAEGLRQRKPQEAAEKAMNSMSQSMQNAPAPGGVPIQIVAGLCLLCFLIAWIFF